MCGLLSFNTVETNGFSQTDFEMMHSMFFLNMLRGTDSTGVMGLTNKDEVYVYKALGNFFNLLNGTNYNGAFRQHMWSRGQLLIGHGRAATRGTVKIENAHPFLVEREKPEEGIVLAHNGTLEAYQGLDGMHKHDVDSEWIAHMLVKEGPEVLGKINGAMALIWYDQQAKTINFFRNAQRPLAVAIAKGQYFVASEEANLHYMKAKHYLDYTHDDVLEFVPMMHCFVKVDDIKALTSVNDLSSTEIKRVTVTKPIADYAKWNSSKYDRYKYRDIEVPENEDWQGQGENDLVGAKGFIPAKGVPGPVSRFHRSLLNDMRRMGSDKDGEQNITRVTWKDGKRFTFFRDGMGTTWETTDSDCVPYEQNLIALDRSTNEPNSITKVYEQKGHRTYVTVPVPKEKDVFGPPVAALLKDTEGTEEVKDHSGANLCINQKFRPGKKFSFHTKTGVHKARLIKHRGRSASSTTDGGNLETYSNDADGDFKLHEEINMEVGEIFTVATTENLEKPVFRVMGFRLKPKMDECVNVQFYVTGKTKEEVMAAPIYRGKVMSMRIVTREAHHDTGAIVMLTINNPVPLIAPEGNVVPIH